MSATTVGRPTRILLVEDNPGDARLVLEMLREAGADSFELDVVDRLELAVERLSGDSVDVVLLDLGLPDSQGLETLERAHREAPQKPFVVISDLDDERMALEAVRSGAQDYLVKGRIDGPLLSRVIRYAIERKRAAAQRDDAAEWTRRLSLAVDQSPASVLITDITGKIEYVNARFTEVTGYTPEEALGKNPRILKSRQTPPEVYEDLWRTVLSGEPWRGELVNRKKDGTLYRNAALIYPIRDPGGRVTHFLALEEDITERRATEEALREREERFRQMTETIREVYFLVDVEFREMLYVSPAYEEIWGHSCESLYRSPGSFLDAVLPEDRPGLMAMIEEILRRGEPDESEYRIERPDGEVRWILVHAGGVRNTEGEVYRMAGVALDITARKEAEEALRTSEQRLRTLFEAVNLIVLALDVDGRIEYVNPFFLGLTGYTREEVFGSDWFERFLPEAQRTQMEGVFGELLEQDLHPHHENPIVTKAGEERLISWHNTVLRDAQDRRIGTLSVGEDVTERARLESHLRQAQKMEAIGLLAGGVAHDFNNLLTAILGNADLLLRGADPASQEFKDLGQIKAAGQRAAVLTRQLLAFSRKQVIEPRVLDLNDVIANLDKMLQRVIGEDVRLLMRPAANLGAVRADPGQIEQVVLNLVVNSRDAMPEGGMLTIETANADLDDAYAERHVPVPPGRYVMLAVSDTGTGMDAATRARVFEPFFTTKPKGKGTGLGLATVYGIVKQSEGYIWLYSEPGKGTTFKVYLPRVDEPVESLAAAAAPEALRGRSETVLVVEDEEIVRTLTRRILEAEGYEVLTAANGEDALRLAEDNADRLALVITDVIMPEMGGAELGERLAELRAGVEVIFVSGYTDETIVRHGVLQPGVHFLQKPFTPAALARKVRDVLDAASS